MGHLNDYVFLAIITCIFLSGVMLVPVDELLRCISFKVWIWLVLNNSQLSLTFEEVDRETMTFAEKICIYKSWICCSKEPIYHQGKIHCHQGQKALDTWLAEKSMKCIFDLWTIVYDLMITHSSWDFLEFTGAICTEISSLLKNKYTVTFCSTIYFFLFFSLDVFVVWLKYRNPIIFAPMKHGDAHSETVLCSRISRSTMCHSPFWIWLYGHMHPDIHNDVSVPNQAANQCVYSCVDVHQRTNHSVYFILTACYISHDLDLILGV